MLSSPWALAQNEEMVKAAHSRGDTVAVFMGVRELASLAPVLLRHYPPSTPLTIVYRAGYSAGGHVVKTTLGDAIATASRDMEKHLAMVYIGPCLR